MFFITPFWVTVQAKVNLLDAAAQLARVVDVKSVKPVLGTIDTTDGPRMEVAGRFGLSSVVKMAEALLRWPKKFVNVSDTVYLAVDTMDLGIVIGTFVTGP